jgi:menaquinone-9 beta-reductase
MLKKEFDFIIIGAGPAGTSLGLYALLNGYTCLILDKALFPREKICGGLLSDKTIKLLSNKLLIDPNRLENIKKIEQFTTYILDEHNLDIILKKPFHISERIYFDNFLLEEFKSRNGEFIQEKITEQQLQNVEDGCIALNDCQYYFKYLIGADGANSIVRKKIGVHVTPAVVGIESSAEQISATLNERAVNLFFDESFGYRWVFPTRDGFNVGTGGFSKTNIQEKHKQFYTSVTGSKEVKAKGAIIPIQKNKNKTYYKKILLVGDAAGFVDPILGEGIYYAMLSSVNIIDSIVDGRLIPKQLELKNNSIFKFMRNARIVNRLVLNKYIKPRFFKFVARKPHVLEFLIQNYLEDGGQIDLSFYQLCRKYLVYRKAL